jgi:beta-ribofuranosylaminobenzene 5'-phosphate synthase
MSQGTPARVTVEAPARLHLGFIDLNGGCGRMFGSIGVAVERPRYVVEIHRASPGEADVDGETAAELSHIIDKLGDDVGVPGSLAVRVLECIPRHQGLGSGTQRDLALGCALARLAGRPLPASEIARRLGRGRRSGIGVAAFERGGLVVDAGVSGVRLGHPRPSVAVDGLPPVVFQQPLPEEWQFVLASPLGEEGLHGSREEAVFRDLPPMSEAVAGRISRLVLMKALPAALTDDLLGFGEAITEIQTLVGEQFAPYQAGPYSSERGRAVAEFARQQGAAGVGQSSWGPTVFALVRGPDAARELVGRIRGFVGDTPIALWHTRASARGAVVTTDS